MRLVSIVLAAAALLCALPTLHALAAFKPSRSPRLQSTTCHGPVTVAAAEPCSRRIAFHSVVASGAMAAATILLPFPQLAYAIPMVTTEEFTSIVRDSARSINVVEFSGPKSETVLVRLVDGTAFGIKDVVESPIDPRSPLKIAAVCNANNIAYKFVDIESLLASSSTGKKKNYANTRVLEAAEKNKEKALRMQQDEELRQAELAEMNRP
jgi:hypothetical protein